MGSLKIGVTGASGFIGSHLLKAFEKNKISFSCLNKKGNPLGSIKKLKDFVADKQIIFHLAAIHRDSNEKLVKINTLGTINLLTAMSQYGPKNAKIVFSSTFQVYKNKFFLNDIAEDTSLDSSSFYALSKIFAEKAIELYCQNYGLKGIIFRLSNVYGQGSKPFHYSVISTFLNLAKNNKTLVINGDGKQKRDFVFVDDVVQSFLKAIEFTPRNFEIFNICSGKLFSINNIIQILSDISKKKLKINYNKNIIDNNYPLKGNYEKTKNLLGWEPKAEFKKELEKLYRSYEG